MQVACLRHFQSEPLSALVPAAAEGPEALAQAWERLPPALRNRHHGQRSPPRRWKGCAAWRSWAVSVRWLHEAAQALGMEAIVQVSSAPQRSSTHGLEQYA